MRLHLRTYQLKLRHTFRIAHDVRDVQPTLIVGLEHEGKIGFGEATANKYYGRPIEAMIEVLESARLVIESSGIPGIEAFMGEVDQVLQTNSFARCAIDVAAHDLYGKLIGQPIHKFWGLDISDIPTTNYTIGIDTIPRMVEKIREFDWPIYKIKLGTNEDLDIIRELRRYSDAVFRVDANCAWTPWQAIDYSSELKRLNVEFIEQPLAADNWSGMKEVYHNSALPVIADESCITESDVINCHGHFHGINIKLMKCGGLLPARRMINEARNLGMKVMVGCMTESSVGISAIGQLLPLLDYVDMDGPLLITNDIASGPVFENGLITLPDRPGTGVYLNEPWI